MAALAGAYYVAAQAGYALQFTGSIAAVWPPVGLAMGVLYLGGLRWWPGVVIGDLLSNTWEAPLGTSIAVTVSNLAEADRGDTPVATDRAPARLDRITQVGGMLVALVPAIAITATVASLSPLQGVIHSDELLGVWRTLWLGDASGALVVLPLIRAGTRSALARRPHTGGRGDDRDRRRTERALSCRTPGNWSLSCSPR